MPSPTLFNNILKNGRHLEISNVSDNFVGPCAFMHKQRDQERPVVEARSLTTRTSATRNYKNKVQGKGQPGV